MAIKKSGTETITSDIYIRVCDFCSETIEENKYPKYELEIETTEYLADGDQADSYDFCSADCLIKFAKKLNACYVTEN